MKKYSFAIFLILTCACAVSAQTHPEDSLVLEESVVIGMGTQKRGSITASVSTVSSEKVAYRPVTDITSALQGNVVGLTISSDAVASGVGGEPGAGIDFKIRGTGSINGGGPYVLVDGVEQSLGNINPADIESITVLKDASASAVYGARAAYGVVLVTTRSGEDSDDPTVSYSGSIGFSTPVSMPEMMSSLEFADHMNMMRENSGKAPLFSPSAIEKIKAFAEDPYSEDLPGVEPNSSKDGWASAYGSQYADTDWFDYYFKDYSMRHAHNLSVSGGSRKIRYYVGAGYVRQGGLIDHVEDELDKYTVNMKFSFLAKEWLRFNLSNNLSVTDIARPMADQTIFYAQISDKYPTQATVLPVGGLYDIPSWNEVMYLKETDFDRIEVSDAVSFSVTATPVEGLDVTAEMRGRLDVQNSTFRMGVPKTTLPGGRIVATSGSRQGYRYPGIHWKNMSFGSYTSGHVFNYYLSPSVNASYQAVSETHFFKVMAGFQAELQENSGGYAYKGGMLSEEVFSFDNADGRLIADESRDHWSTMGFFARANWNWKEMVFAEISGRADGSSRFAPGSRWGLFPSASVGYDLAATEIFRESAAPFSQLKIRLSYGRLGNQSGAGLYEYLGLMNVSSSSPGAWLLPGATQEAVTGAVAFAPSMISPHITWEKVDNADIGLDVLAFGNRMSLVFDAYQRVTRDMLGPAEAIPSFSGIAASDRARTNNATLRNRGWELSLSWTDRFSGGFRYRVGFNVFDYRAKVTAYSNPEGVISNNHTGLEANKGYYAGMDIGEIWGYKADRLFESDEEAALYPVDLSFFKARDLWKAGDLMYEDVDGDGAVNPGKGTVEDHGDLVVIGNATPRFSFGINLSAGYKGLEVTALLQGVGKRDFPMAGSTYLFGGRNYFKDHLDRFSPENPSGWLPRLTDGTGSGDLDWKVNTGYNTSRYLLNGAYMRLKNLMVSYSFGGKVLGKLRLRDLKVYVSCDNLLTLDALPGAFDPETMNIVSTWAGGSLSAAPGLTSALSQNGNGKVYPLSRTMVMGVEIKF